MELINKNNECLVLRHVPLVSLLPFFLSFVFPFLSCGTVCTALER